MAIAREGFVNRVSGTGVSSSSWNYTLINGSGNNRLLLIGITFEEDTTNSRSISSVTYDGVNMSQVGGSPISFPDTGLKLAVSLWYMLDANLPSTAGSYQAVVTADGVVTDEIYSPVVEYSGVQQSVPDDVQVDENLSAGSTSVTMSVKTASSMGFIICGSGGTTSLSGNENNVTSITTSTMSSSAGGVGEKLNQSAGFTFGYNNLAIREGCIGAVWSAAPEGYAHTVNTINGGAVNLVAPGNITAVNGVT